MEQILPDKTFKKLEKFTNQDNEDILEIIFDQPTQEGELEESKEILKPREAESLLASWQRRLQKDQEMIDYYQAIIDGSK